MSFSKLREAKRQVQQKLTELLDERKRKLGDLPELVEKRDVLHQQIQKLMQEGGAASQRLSELRQQKRFLTQNIQRRSAGKDEFYAKKAELRAQLDELCVKMDSLRAKRELTCRENAPSLITEDWGATPLDDWGSPAGPAPTDPCNGWGEALVTPTGSKSLRITDSIGKALDAIKFRPGDTAAHVLQSLRDRQEWPENVELQLCLKSKAMILPASFRLDDIPTGETVTLLQWLRPHARPCTVGCYSS